MAKKNELTLLLQEYRATIEDSGSLSIDATYEVDGIEENTEVPIEFQMIVEAGKHKYDSSPSVVRVLSQDQNSFYASAYFDCDPDQLPDKFQIFYRLFGSKKSFVVEPNIATKKGGGSLSLPPKNILGANKWAASNFSLNSVFVKNDDGDFWVEWSGSSTRHSDLYLSVFARSGSDEFPGGLLIKSPAVADAFFINGSTKLSLSFDLYKAEKWQNIEKVSDLKFEHQESEDDDFFSDDDDIEETIEYLSNKLETFTYEELGEYSPAGFGGLVLEYKEQIDDQLILSLKLGTDEHSKAVKNFDKNKFMDAVLESSFEDTFNEYLEKHHLSSDDVVLEISLYDIDEANAPESSSTSGTEQNWHLVTEQALNRYFNTVRKTDDILEAEQTFMDELTAALEDAGIEWDEFPYDISVNLLEQITDAVKKHLESLREEFPQFVEGLLDPFHTYFDGLLHDYLQNDDLSDEEKKRVKALVESWST